MKNFSLEGVVRNDFGKQAAREMRKAGLIPAVLNGGKMVELPYEGPLLPGEKVVPLKDEKRGIIVTEFAVSPEAVRKLVYTPNIYAVDLTIGEKKVKAIMKDLQFHPVNDNILHLDFLQVEENKPIVMEVPVQLEGLAEGVRAGGKLALQLRKLKVKATYDAIPERLVIDVTPLGLGKTIKVGELNYEGLELINAKEAVVCAVKLTRAARGAQAAAAAGKK